MNRAIVIGSGPNGLAAATVVAQAGLPVEVFEAEDTPGGAVRSLPLTLPGFTHDFGSAVYPLAAGSPFFSSLSLKGFGLAWIHSDAPIAHPLDDGKCVVLERNLADAARELGADGLAWESLMSPFVNNWDSLAQDVLGPPLRIPNHPLLMARFGLNAFQSAKALAERHFQTARVRALFAGLAAHSFMNLDAPLSAAAGMLLGVAAHAVGWPIPRGGAQNITKALVSNLQSLGGKIITGRRIDHSAWLAMRDESTITLCDTSTTGLLSVAGDRLNPSYRASLKAFRRASGVFKVDYALSEPVPWQAASCLRAATVHVGGTFEQISSAEQEVLAGGHPERPFVLVAQPSLFDPSRAPAGKQVLWTYCHVPKGSIEDMTSRIESQIERFAPGFRECILARRISNSAILETMDANLTGGDISGGAFSLRQFLFRPTVSGYATGAPDLFLCSASTPPGGGVHGMCGYHAARRALRSLR